MQDPVEDRRWADYLWAQVGRQPRQQLRRALALVGPGEGRRALDLGCGLGVETRAMLEAGFAVVAIDGQSGTVERVQGTVGAGWHDRLTVAVADLSELPELPPASLVYSGLTLPFLAPAAFTRLWGQVRACLAPDGVVAVDLFGDRDSWASSREGTYLVATAGRRLFDGLKIVAFDIEERDGPFFGGTKHWHVYHVLARRTA